MFRASRGQGGSGGANNSGAQKAQVTPKSAIVVANKFAEITQTLNSNYERATSGVAEQVAQNRKDIENLYKLISDRREQELKNEKAESAQLRIDGERKRRSIRENFIEGISSAAAAMVKPLQSIANAAQKPIMSLWDKIKNALLLLAAAWVIDNLPEIIKTFKKFFKDLDKFKSTISSALVNIRGVFYVFDKIVRTIFKVISSIVRTSFRIARKIITSGFRIARKVIGAITKVVTTVTTAIFNGIRGLVSNLLKQYDNLRNAMKPPTPTPGSGGKPKPKGNFITRTFNNIKNWTGDRIKQAKQLGSKTLGKLQDIGSFAADKLNPAKSYATKEGIEKGSNAAREKGLKKMLSPILDAMGLGKQALGKIGKIIRPLLRLPGIGIAVDVALNKAGGQSWVEAILRGLPSALAGVAGWKGGAIAGAGVGSMIFPGVGTAIGGGLGAIIGSIIAANLADGLAKNALDSVGIETTSDEEQAKNLQKNVVDPVINNVSGNGSGSNVNFNGIVPPAQKVTGGNSTPDGMQTPEGSTSQTNINIEELPPVMENIKPEQEDEVVPEQSVPSIYTRDPQTDSYRRYATNKYQLDLAGAFG